MTNKQNQVPSLHSPKNKFHVEVYYDQPLIGVGSVVSFGTMNIDGIHDYIRRHFMNNQPHVRFVVKENKKDYPQFDWQLVMSDDINA